MSSRAAPQPVSEGPLSVSRQSSPFREGCDNSNVGRGSGVSPMHARGHGSAAAPRDVRGLAALCAAGVLAAAISAALWAYPALFSQTWDEIHRVFHSSAP